MRLKNKYNLAFHPGPILPPSGEGSLAENWIEILLLSEQKAAIQGSLDVRENTDNRIGEQKGTINSRLQYRPRLKSHS